MKTKNLTILLTDIVGYTEATAHQSRQENEDLLALHNRILFPVFKRFGGRLVKMIGDALLLVFTSPTDAMLCAMAMQDALFEHNRSVQEEKQIHIRIAASLGEVRLANRDIFGEPVNMTSRIEGITPQDEIYLSDAVYMTMNKAEVPCIEVGRKELKGIAEPVRIWQIPRFSRPRLVPEDIMSSADLSELAYPFGGAHLLTGTKRKGLLGGFDPGGRSVAMGAIGLLLLAITGFSVLFLVNQPQDPELPELPAMQPLPAVPETSSQTEPVEPDQQPVTVTLPERPDEAAPLGAVAAAPPPAIPAPQGIMSPPPQAVTPVTREPRPDPAIVKLKQDLRAENSATRRRAIKSIARSHGHDAVLLAVVEAELLKGYDQNLADRNHVDAIAWMCKVLAASGEGRYRKTLDTVAARATNPKIRKYAEKSRDQLN